MSDDIDVLNDEEHEKKNLKKREKIIFEDEYLKEKTKIEKIENNLYLSFPDFGIRINFKNKDVYIFEYAE
jgi:hypothetical protein